MKTVLTLLLGGLAAQAAMAQPAIKTLYSFGGPDGGSPNSIVQATDGFFYGTAAIGGANVAGLSDGGGTVFKLSPLGVLTTLHAFTATDGYNPAGLIQGSDGLLYGATFAGGQPSGGGGGTIFKIDSTGHFTTLHAFTGGFGGTDGGGPSGPPILASDGFLYGLTSAGGAFRDIDHQGGFGTAYKINPTTGATTIIHSFNFSDPNGIFPSGRLIQGADGAFYGTTREGALGGGSVFRMTSTGFVTLVKALTDSGEPLDGVIQASDGYLYGTTDAAGGTIFRVSTTGTSYKVLNQFDGTDGWQPHFGLFQPSPGLLFGTTPQGGVLDFQGGAIFRIGTGGTMVVLHSFTRTLATEGFIPNSRLIMGSDGALYGVTGMMGANGHGTVFRFDQRVPGPLSSISVPATLTATDVSSGTVTLTSFAPAGGKVVGIALQSYQATTPPNITIAAGATSGRFAINVGSVGADQVCRVYAMADGRAIRTSITLLMAPKVASFLISPTSIQGGGTATATVALSRAAPLAGATLVLSSNSFRASVPSSVKVPGGTTSVTFPVKTGRVKSTTLALLNATYNGTSASTTLTITP